MSQLKVLIALTPLVLAGCFGSDPEHTEYFPEANGDKPGTFELGFVEVCQGSSTIFREAARFADRYGAGRHVIAEPEDRIVATYTFGLPMKAHLMVERLYEDRYRVAVSTFRGYPTDVVLAARQFNFCGVVSAPSNSSFKPKPLRGSA